MSWPMPIGAIDGPPFPPFWPIGPVDMGDTTLSGDLMRLIFIVDTEQNPDGSFTLKAVAWLTAPPNRVKPMPTFVSVVPLVSAVPWGVTPSELAALQSGAVVETPFNSPQQASGAPVPSTKADLQSAFSALQSTLTASAISNKYIGAYWDGTTWTPAP